MDIAAISNLSNSGLSIGAIISGILISLLALLIRWRTGSSLTILARLWALFHGKTSATIPFIKDHLDSLASVVELRFKVGAPVRTEEHALRLITWGKDHDESLIDAVRCGSYFDFEGPGLKDSSEQLSGKQMATLGFIFFACTMMAVGCLSMSTLDRALLKLKLTDTWFTMSINDARPIFSKGFEFKNCSEPLGQTRVQTGFTVAETKLLCDAVREEGPSKLQVYLKQTVTEQRQILSGLAALFIVPLFPLFLTMQYDSNARAMRERLRKRALASTSARASNKDAEEPIYIEQG